MGAERLIANLPRIAREDLDGAVVLAAADNRNADYLLEQAAEKTILAVLTSEGIHGGVRHQLDDVEKVRHAITEAASRFEVDLSKRDAPARNPSPIR